MKTIILVLSLTLLTAFAVFAPEAGAQISSIQPKVVNVTLTTAGTQYSLTIPTNTTRVRITARGGDVKYSWTAGAIAGGTFATISQGSAICQGNVRLSSAGQVADVLYMTGSVNGVVAEVELWK